MAGQGGVSSGWPDCEPLQPLLGRRLCRRVVRGSLAGRLCRLLVGDLLAVMLDRASRGCPDDGVMTRDVSGDSAHCCAFETSLGVALCGQANNHPGDEGRGNQSVHMSFRVAARSGAIDNVRAPRPIFQLTVVASLCRIEPHQHRIHAVLPEHFLSCDRPMKILSAA